jgi:hypothetical protein
LAVGLNRADVLRFYRRSSLWLAVLIVAFAILRLTERAPAFTLPTEFRIPQKSLSGLPVSISELTSCTCWTGPRFQAQRKYKFRIVNRSDAPIPIGGGRGSSVRLLVAYKDNDEKVITPPKPDGDSTRYSLASPRDALVRGTEAHETMPLGKVVESNRLFGVPENFSIWVIPPNPNKLFERGGDRRGGYPTFIETEVLAPDTAYGVDRRNGHGVWSFYIPLPNAFQGMFPPGAPFEMVLDRADIESEIIVIGIAAFGPGGDLLGFAPAPSDDALRDPKSL